jgi:O-acetyl-ADP-ribose deacetylase (regulator of RNase III)
MEGGIDYAFTQRFGRSLQERLQLLLSKVLLLNAWKPVILHSQEWLGELPVGCAVVVPTDSPVFEYCVSAPTMRVPCDVSDTPNAFLAFRAAITAVKQHNKMNPVRKIDTLLCPGLATATGAMPYWRCAEQMKLAFEKAYFPRDQYIPSSYLDAIREHNQMCMSKRSE